jgi:hypothetical protein
MSVRSETSNFDFSKQHVEAKISLFNKPLDSIDSSIKIVTVSNPDAMQLEIN